MKPQSEWSPTDWVVYHTAVGTRETVSSGWRIFKAAIRVTLYMIGVGILYKAAFSNPALGALLFFGPIILAWWGNRKEKTIEQTRTSNT